MRYVKLGVSNDYFELYNLPLAQGCFYNDYQEECGMEFVSLAMSELRSL
jgi:hypothetical protein